MTRLKPVGLVVLAVGFTCILVLGSCATQPPIAESGAASRELRSPLGESAPAVRSRTYEAAKPVVFESVISVLEALGYTIRGISPDTGVITAEGPVEEPAPASLGVSRTPVASALVEEAGVEVRVIVHFAIRSEYSGAYGRGAPETVTAFETGLTDDSYSYSFTTTIYSDRDPNSYQESVLDADLYRNAFDQIEEAILARS